VRAAPLSPVVGQSDFARLGRLTTLLPLRSSVDTGAGNRGGDPAEFAVVAGTVGCRERMLARWSSGRGEPNLRTQSPKFRTASPKMVTYPEGLVGTREQVYNRYYSNKHTHTFYSSHPGVGGFLLLLFLVLSMGTVVSAVSDCLRSSKLRSTDTVNPRIVLSRVRPPL
jgi:hypothetical protein